VGEVTVESELEATEETTGVVAGTEVAGWELVEETPTTELTELKTAVEALLELEAGATGDADAAGTDWLLEAATGATGDDEDAAGTEWLLEVATGATGDELDKVEVMYETVEEVAVLVTPLVTYVLVTGHVVVKIVTTAEVVTEVTGLVLVRVHGQSVMVRVVGAVTV
jgi:hypothetical protein